MTPRRTISKRTFNQDLVENYPVVNSTVSYQPRQTDEENDKKVRLEGGIHGRNSRTVILTVVPRHRPRRVRTY